MGGGGVDSGYSIITDTSGNVYVTGYFGDTVNFGSDWSGTDSKTSAGSYDIFITKITPMAHMAGQRGWRNQ